MESKDPLTAFDAVGFTLQYELSYTNILAMLDLAGIPLLAPDRDERWPLIISGGPCACNAEPIADFFDVIQLGEGEQKLPDICAAVETGKKAGWYKKQLLLEHCKDSRRVHAGLLRCNLPRDGRVEGHHPQRAGHPGTHHQGHHQGHEPVCPAHQLCCAHGGCHSGPCQHRGAARLRARLPVLSGGLLVPPHAPARCQLAEQGAQDLCANTGYEELSLSSLSTSDHGQLEELLDDLNEWAPKEHVSLSLPSLRVDNFSQSLIEKTTKVRKSGLTFAAEAGTQRLRDVINKNVTWDEIEKTCPSPLMQAIPRSSSTS